jgi:uncharacterized membrane protein (UPF0182 family)
MRNKDPFEDLLRSLEENLSRGSMGGSGGDVPPPPGPQRPYTPAPPPNYRRWFWIALVLVVIFAATRTLGTLATWTWMSSVGYLSVFWTRFGAMALLFLGAALLFLLIYFVNIVIARQLSPSGLTNSPLQELLAAFGARVMPVILLLGIIAAVVMGMVAMAQWENVLLYLNQKPFNITDPIFDREIGFYIYSLPIWEAVRGWLLVALGFTFVAVFVIHGVLWRGRGESRRGILHLGVLGALIMLLLAWQYQLSAYNMVYSARGAVFGAGFADVRATLPANQFMVIFSVLVAIAIPVILLLRRNLTWIAGLLVLWVVVGLTATSVYPQLIQRFRVGPNELTLEAPYIANNIAYTRSAYALNEIRVESYDARQQLTSQGLLQEPDTLRNIRLWDYRPLLQTYNQVQALRQYYEFNDVDIDRYTIDGKPRQVMIGARELIRDRLSTDAQTWVNQRLVYTHGFGVAASPVAQVTRDGLPTFLLKDLPPRGLIDVTSPQIYFGERTDDYVVGATDAPEFDYPREDGNVTTRFSAATGIPMTLWNRLLFALHFGDVNLILNGDISAESRLLWQRNIVERVQLVAPFLTYDHDPYIIVSGDGKLFWMHDAYTTSSRYPYSQPLDGRINYIRNAVKVITNAYDGTMTFYIADATDPIIQTYAAIFPQLFRPMSEMPVDLLDNVRYPEDMFRAQAEIYRTYHMTDATEFYNREDVWAWPEEIFDDKTVKMDPYYVLMQLPGNSKLEYVMILPYTPSNRENMVAWLAVQSEPDKYGDKVLYNFGKDSLLFGPKQIEARIDQDPVISSQLSLWNQQGSSVIRGNLLVLPIADSLLYVEPLYLQAASGRIPELQRVVVATADNVAMADNLGAALVALFGNQIARSPVIAELGANAVSPSDAAVQVLGESAAPATVEDLILQANAQFATAQERLREGDFAGYGELVDALQATLRDLARVGGIALPTPTPAAPAVDASAATTETGTLESGEAVDATPAP